MALPRWSLGQSHPAEHGTPHQIIDVQGLPRHFGGVQWYLRCPVTGEQVLTLWMPRGASIFAGRNAWQGQVAYRSQFEDELGSAWGMKKRVVRRLGSSDPDDHQLRARPAWMRHKTYEALVEQYLAAEVRVETICDTAIKRLLTRHGMTYEDVGLKP